MEVLSLSMLTFGAVVIVIGTVLFKRNQQARAVRAHLTPEHFAEQFQPGPEREAAKTVYTYFRDVQYLGVPPSPEDDLQTLLRIDHTQLEQIQRDLLRQRGSSGPAIPTPVRTVRELIASLAQASPENHQSATA